MAAGFDEQRLGRLDAAMARACERGDMGSATWAVSRGDQVHLGATGTHGPGGTPATPSTIFRISSMTKPVTGATATALLEEGLLRLDDPIERWLPELASRPVLRTPTSALDDTVAAQRPVTVHDVLTFTLGMGIDFTTAERQPVVEAMAKLGLGEGPPCPATYPELDEWLRRLATLPLAAQPGQRWLYNTGAEVASALCARAAGTGFDEVVRSRILAPLAMADTGFWVDPDDLDRFGPCLHPDGSTFDPVDGQWSQPPPFPNGADGLVSTASDLVAFGRALLAGGRAPGGGRILARPNVATMTTDRLTPDQRATAGFDPSGGSGFGFCVGVLGSRDGLGPSAGSFGWEGGLGSSWSCDPAEDLVGVLLTDTMWTSPVRPPVVVDFWTAAYAAIDD